MNRKDIMMRGLVFASLILTLFLGLTASANAQEATPASAGCTIEPRTDEELDALAATPYVPPAATPEVTSTALPAGEPVDERTIAALTDTLNQVTACAEVGDINRLLALYSDEYVVQHIFAREPQPIIPGRAPEDGAPPAATPGAPLAASEVHEANLLPDGRIAANVATGDALDIVFFVQGEDDRWLIDGIQSVASGSDGATPEGNNYPQPVQIALEAAADRLGVSVDELTIESVEPMDWPDTSLGCPKEGQFYAQVITPGYLVLVSANDTTVEYHTDEASSVVFCGEK
jgi:hypothetical protein